ncbi:hypothetical protein FISHEDRAFT_12822, partial [Fistulina hepatica ATCC 64428]
LVGNIPYNMGEEREQLIEVFKSVGQVVGLRLVFDRETGKPRGYGFCEFADHETAQSAVRNLNNAAVGGRPLRIDLADSDPFLEGKSTQRGELLQDDGRLLSDDWRDERYDRRDFSDRDKGADRRDPNAFLAAIPPGIAVPPGSTALDTISQTLATMNPSKLMEVLAQMKAFTILHPDQARALLVAHPQLAYALFQALLLNKIVDPAILQRMLAATAPPPQQLQQPAPAPAPPMGYAPPPTSMQQNAPPASSLQKQQGPPPPHSPATQQNTVAGQSQPTQQLVPEINESQRAMLMQVMSLTPEQINTLSEPERQAINQLVSLYL